MIKKLIMLSVAIMATVGVYAEFLCSAEVGVVVSGSANRKGTVTWRNTGSLGVTAPYVRVTAGDGVLIRLSDADAWGKSIEFLATSTSLPASTLKAGEEGSLVFSCQSESDDGKLELSWTLSSAEAFPWAELGASLKPSYVSSDAWTFALSTLKTRFGTTWDTYLTRLRANADYLAGLGRSVNRIDRLMQIEIGRALGVDAVFPVIDSATDAGSFARGISLAFSRTYSSAMYSRFTSGILGYGWTDNYSAYAELTDDKTLVFRLPGGGSYSFTKETGSWQPEDARDKTVLSESSSAYTLTYQSGTVQTFAKSNMRIASIADNSGNAITFTWNGTNLTKATHTDGQSLIFDYSNGLLSSVTDDCGRKTQYTYSNSLLTKVTSPDGLTVSYEYRPVDNTAVSRALSRIIYPDGTTREFTYDTSSGLVSEVSVNGGKEKTMIARTGGVVTLTSADGAVTTIKTGISGEVLEMVDALGGITTQGYTEDGLLKAIVSPSGLAGSITHDTLGRVSKSVSAAGTETAFSYESTFGNLKTVTDAKNHAITYGYDSKGRGTSVSFVDDSASRLEYNDRGDIIKSTNRRGESISYQYDSKGRLTKKTWANGRTFTYDYDARGNITTASDSETGTVTMRYDSVDRIIKIVYPTGRGFTFVYDSCGRLSSRASLDGSEECFTYDALGRIATVTDGKDMVYLKNSYDATTGRLTKQENGNGTSVLYLYDKLGRIVSIEHRDAKDKIVESLQYCYDADGRCIRAASLLGEERYGYDKDGQLTSVEYPDDTEEAFVYDAVGNRASRTGGSPVQNETYTVNNLNQYTEIVNAQAARSTMTYDKDGNMTSLTDADGTTSYYYDTLNRLVAVTNATKNIRWSCTYDVFGNRVSVTDNGITTERTYLQGSLPSVAAEYVNGELKERHILVGAVRIADVSKTGGSPVQNEETRYYHADLIGSTRLVTDGSGAIIDRRAYKAFGETRMGGASSSTIDTAGYVGTLGVETDTTGLLFMRNRYYSPSLGRFIQMDPIGLNGEDVNLYRYCGNVSLQLVDIDGCTSLGATIVNFSNFVGNDVFGGNGVLNFQDLVVDKTVDLATDNYGKLIENKVRLFGKGSRGALKRAKIVSGNIGQLGFIYDISTFSSEFLITLATQGIDGAAKVSRQFFLEMALSPGVMLGEIVAGVVYWFSGSQRELERSYERVMRDIRLEKMQSCIVLIRPDGGGGSGGGGDNPASNPSNPDNPGSGGGSEGGGAIMNESDWLDIATNKNAKTATYSLGADITFLNPKSIISGFKGKFVGNGFKLTVGTGKNIFSSADGAHFTGAFTLDGALVGRAENCTFDNCAVTGDFTDGGSGNGTGGLANNAQKCVFIDCSAAGKVISSNEAVGGLVGEAVECSFENCSVDGSLTGKSKVGGFVGEVNNCSFSGCKSNVTIIKGAGDDIGGFVGWSENSEFSHCEANVSVEGLAHVGGFVGASKEKSKFVNCKAIGSVSGKSDVGGFAGYMYDGGEISKCSAGVDVSVVENIEPIGCFGGFIGSFDSGKVWSCISTGSVIADKTSSVGGFFGEVHGDPRDGIYASISKCCSKGTVKGGTNVGGFSGSILYSEVSDCLASGSVTAVGQTLSAGGYSTTSAAVGGFAAIASSQTGGVTLRNCYASGKVTTIASDYSDFMNMVTSSSGGMTPYVNTIDPCNSCYWNIGTTGQKYSGTGTGLTAANAKKQSSYVGWDFVNTWKMGSNGPELRDVGATLEVSANYSKVKSFSDDVGLQQSFMTLSNSSDFLVKNNFNNKTPKYHKKLLSSSDESFTSGSKAAKSKRFSKTVDSPSLESRLYCYERYVLVRGYSYEFEVSNDGDDAVSVSGLPSGLTFANGVISGVVTSEGTSTATISLTSAKGTVAKSLPFVVIAPPEDFEDETLSTYIVTFNANGGVVSPSTYTLNVGSEIGTLPVPTLNGYVFDGWYTSATEGVKVTSSTVVTENLTLYARWKSTAEIKPDLIVSSVKLSKSIISLSDSVTLTCIVSNRGTADSNQSYTKFSYCNVNKHDPCPKLKAGEEYTHTITLLGQNLGIGTHTILVNADETNNNNENNESNNTDRITIKVSTPDPDPTSNVDWAYMALYNTEPDAFYLSTAPNLQKSSVKFEYGQPIYVQMGFYNSKRVSTRGEVRVRFSLNTGASTHVSWANLEKDRMAILTEEGRDISILQNLAPGNYTLTSVIDYNSLWRESNEENNIRTISFTVTSPAITCIVTLDANGGSVSTTSHSVVSGSAVGRLPRPSRNGYKFVGWFTSPTEGVKVTESTIVTENITYYAHWTLSEEDYNNALYAELLGEIPTSTASVYDGYIYQGDEIIGTIQSKVAKPKNGIAKVTATIQIIGEKKVSIKSELDVDSGILVAYAKDGRELYLELGSDGMTGNFDGYDIDGARNFFDSKDKSEKSDAEEILKPYLGAYSMVSDGGILSVTIAKKGKVTVKGSINGSKVSAKAQVLIGEDMICIPVVYSKSSVNLAFTIWLPINGGNAEILGLDGDPVIGKAGTLKNGAEFIIDGDLKSLIPDLIEEIDGYCVLPDGESVSVSGSKWVIADGVKAAKVAYKKGVLTITEGKKGAGIANPSGLKLSYKSKDGSFKGSFTTYAIANGKLKKHKATVEGVLVNGIGYGTITIKKIGTWGVAIE